MVEYIVTSITIVVVAVPEGLPLAVTISLAFSVVSYFFRTRIYVCVYVFVCMCKYVWYYVCMYVSGTNAQRPELRSKTCCL